uniref:CLLAC-motif containing domain-containing protein n=1 Tax=Loxodonta africana TaxID=9785 RepID=G3UFS8_LOXAF
DGKVGFYILRLISPGTEPQSSGKNPSLDPPPPQEARYLYNLIFKHEKKGQWSLVSIFLVCFLACILTTAVAALILSVVYVNNSQPHSGIYLRPETWPLQTTMIPIMQKAVDPKFQFLNHLPKSKVFEFPGGAIQWARYRYNVHDYLSDEEE